MVTKAEITAAAGQTYDKPHSLCMCGHTGDGQDSQHRFLYVEGHGGCTVCGCPQFRWKGWTLPFAAHLRAAYAAAGFGWDDPAHREKP